MARLVLALLALALLVMGPAWAEEARPAAAPLLLKLLNVPADSPETLFREALSAEPAARPSPEWVLLPDGSARYGTDRVFVIVGPPCVSPSRAVAPVRGLR